MSHNSSISGMGEPVQAIRLINEKQLLQLTVGINIILSCGKKCKICVGINLQARAGELRFLTGEEN